MDRNELMEFLRGVNINLTQNNIQGPIVAPFDNDIKAYIEGRWSDIHAHEISKFSTGDSAMVEVGGAVLSTSESE